ncbi:MAG: ROK family protein [Candidatus Acidiferrales bacterium]
MKNRKPELGSHNLVLGVDIGGTKIAAGLVNSRGRVLHAASGPMIARLTTNDGLRAVLDTMDSVMANVRASKVAAIGVCVPGWVDSERGVLLSATNLPCWRNFALARNIVGHSELPVRLTNDANAAALAEAKWGAGAAYRDIFYVSLGTGVGTAMVRDGEISHGRTGGGEGGHMTINFRGPLCGCGKRGCIEMYASGTAIARRARGVWGESGSFHSRAMQMAGGGVSGVTAEFVSKAAAAGDALAKQILEEAADRLAIWLGGIIDLLEPQAIVIGGGMGRVMISFRGRIRQRLETWAINPRRHKIPIVGARYGPQSGIAGAAAQWFARRSS